MHSFDDDDDDEVFDDDDDSDDDVGRYKMLGWMLCCYGIKCKVL